MNTTLTAPQLTGSATYGGDDRTRRAGGPPLSAIVDGLSLIGARVLVAGPHDDALVDAVAESGATVTWLLRSTRDATRAARRHPSVTVVTGDLRESTTTDDHGRDRPFDLVIAADGLDRLASAESPDETWRARLDRLTALLADDGAILLHAVNPVGVAALSRLDRPAIPVDTGPDDAPESLDGLTSVLVDRGFTVRAWSTFGEGPASVLVERAPSALDAGSVAEILAAAVRPVEDGPALLGDVAPLMRVAVRTGRIADAASGWLVHARRVGEPCAAAPLIVADRARPDQRLSYQVDDGGIVVRSCGTAVHDGIARDPDGTVAGPGPSAESLLLAACAAGDRPAVRRVLRSVVAMLRESAVDGTLDGALALTTLDRLRIVDGAPVPTDSTWRSTAPVGVDVVVARVIRRAADSLLSGGHPHPWTTDVDGASLTAILAGAAGVVVADDDLHAAVDLETRWRALAFDLDDERAASVRDRLRHPSDMDPPVSSAGYRELWIAWRSARSETLRLRERSEWEAQILASRDLAIAKLDEELAMYRATFFGRLLRLLRIVAGAARADAKKAFRRLRPGGDR